MKTLYLILIFCVFGFTSIQAQDTIDNDFTVLFYQYPNFKEEVGFIAVSLPVGRSIGYSNRVMSSVGSFTADPSLQVTIFSENNYLGKSQTYIGSKENITPAFHKRDEVFVNKETCESNADCPTDSKCEGGIYCVVNLKGAKYESMCCSKKAFMSPYGIHVFQNEKDYLKFTEKKQAFFLLGTLLETISA